MGFENFKELSIRNSDCEVKHWYKEGTERKFIILLHGASCDHFMFEKQVGIFDDSYHIIVWDARAHGLSELNVRQSFSFKEMYDDCLKIFEYYQIEQATLIGQSMGGNLAQEIAYYQPEKVNKLILIESTKNTQKLSSIESFTLKYAKTILKTLPWKWYISNGVKLSGVTEYTKNYVRNCLLKTGKNRHIEIMLSTLNVLHEDTNYRFSMPVLLICGEESKAGNIKKALSEWAKSDNSISLKIIANASHCANMDNPEEVNKHILEFIN